MATDMGGIHAKNSSNQAQLIITVKRNKKAPEFQNLPYKKTIQQTKQPGTFMNVHARDHDDRVCGILECLCQNCWNVFACVGNVSTFNGDS